jgi:hypothetical protein
MSNLLNESKKAREAVLKAAAHEKKPLQQFKKFVGKAAKATKHSAVKAFNKLKGKSSGRGM